MLGAGLFACFLCALALSWAATARASTTPTKISPATPMTLPAGGGPLTAIDGTVYFAAADDGTGPNSMELWKSDGTDAGTVMVKDVDPSDLTNVNGTLYFSTGDGAGGWELWKSDGTDTGTKMVKDVDPGGNSPIPHELTNVDGTLYFVADDGTDGEALWKSDGTDAGTVIVKDVNPTQDPLLNDLSDVGGQLFFEANDGTHGEELWRSDGTAAGTVMVKDINPGGSSDPEWVFNRRLYSLPLYFSADAGTDGFELWKTDGTEAGTEMVVDIWPGAESSHPIGFLRFGADTFFAANDGTHGIEPWATDGTAAGTHILKDINPGSASSTPNDREVSDGIAYFDADDGTHGEELWRSDGTEAGTEMVKDIDPGSTGGLWPGSPELTDLNGTLYFVANDATHGKELWRSDGTEAGTEMVDDIAAGGASSTPGSLTVADGTLYFTADDGAGRQLYSLTPPGGDADGDGIADEIDTEPGTPSDEFSDHAAPTRGKIIDRGGLDVTITDAAYTDGVNVRAVGSGGEATLSVCGGQIVKVAADSEAVVTCGSVSVRVVEGEAQVSAGDGSVVVSVPEGGAAKLVEDDTTGSISVESSGGGPVTVSLPNAEKTTEISIPAAGAVKLVEDEATGSIDIESTGQEPLTVTTEGGSAELRTEETKTVARDTTAPDTVIEAHPPILTNSASPSFGFSGTDGGSGVAGFQCRLDSGQDGAWGSCASPKVYASLADGSHTFEVRAVDRAGNLDGSPATFAWTVDTTAPETTIDSGPSGDTEDSSPSFAFSASEAGASFECGLDGGSFASCTSPRPYTNLSAGAHSFAVRATDAAGNPDPTPATRDFTIVQPSLPPNTPPTGGGHGHGHGHMPHRRCGKGSKRGRAHGRARCAGRHRQCRRRHGRSRVHRKARCAKSKKPEKHHHRTRRLSFDGLARVRPASPSPS